MHEGGVKLAWKAAGAMMTNVEGPPWEEPDKEKEQPYGIASQR